MGLLVGQRELPRLIVISDIERRYAPMLWLLPSAVWRVRFLSRNVNTFIGTSLELGHISFVLVFL